MRHPYQWSSLGRGGAQDAYTVTLDVTFAAGWSVRVNGQGQGWQPLPSRTLRWQASHQVQEAQAMLARRAL